MQAPLYLHANMNQEVPKITHDQLSWPEVTIQVPSGDEWGECPIQDLILKDYLQRRHFFMSIKLRDVRNVCHALVAPFLYVSWQEISLGSLNQQRTVER